MSTSGGTRAARAATSRQVKQELVRLLFGKQYSRKGPEAHKMLDYSIYSYSDLRKAYLGRIQEIHPDKARSNKDLTATMTHESIKEEFHDLQNAWDKYEEMASEMKKVGDGDKEDSNFTMFGVGCSFSDSEAERALRNEITDQACRGWFSSGEIAATSTFTSNSSASNGMRNAQTTSLLHDDMFEEVIQESETDEAAPTWGKPSKPKTLIPGLK